MKRRIAVGIGLLLVLSSFTAAGAATSPTESQERAAARLYEFQVLQGQGTLPNGQPDLALDQSLTRAELATIMVRALGVDWRLSNTMRPAPYPDVSPGAWYAPQIHLLKNVAAEKGMTLGTAAGNFEPGRPVTRIEAIVLALKLIGLKPTEAGEPWHQPWVALASQLGVLTKVEANNIGLEPDAPITRGEAFLYLDRLLGLPLLPAGALYERIDRVPPTLVMSPEPKVEYTEATVVLSGTATDNRRIVSITANGARLELSESGWFVSQPIPLQMGLNELELHVEDGNGNAIIKTWQVMRTEP